MIDVDIDMPTFEKVLVIAFCRRSENVNEGITDREIQAGILCEGIDRDTNLETYHLSFDETRLQN